MGGAIDLEDYCYQDYLDINRNTKEYIELIDGKIYMLLDESKEHKNIVENLFFILKNIAKEKDNIYYPKVAPCELELFCVGDINIVQPDVILFDEDDKPLAIFEVISSTTSQKDMGTKKELYERFGIKEYFIVDGSLKIVDKYELVDEKYSYIRGFYTQEQMKINCFDYEIDTKEIFPR